MTQIIRIPKWYEIKDILAFDTSCMGCNCFHSQHVSMKEYMLLNLLTILCDVILGLALLFYLNSSFFSHRQAYVLGIISTIVVSMLHYVVSKYLERYFFVRNAWRDHVNKYLTHIVVNR